MSRLMVVKEFTFDAAHFLPNYDGPCASLHGHTYKLQVGVSMGILDSSKGGRWYVQNDSGMLMDFTKLKEIVSKYLSRLDHTLLNSVEIREFPTYMPTAENMVLWFEKVLSDEILLFAEEQGVSKSPIELEMIRLWETPTSYAEWRRE